MKYWAMGKPFLLHWWQSLSSVIDRVVPVKLICDVIHFLIYPTGYKKAVFVNINSLTQISNLQKLIDFFNNHLQLRWDFLESKLLIPCIKSNDLLVTLWSYTKKVKNVHFWFLLWHVNLWEIKRTLKSSWTLLNYLFCGFKLWFFKHKFYYFKVTLN